MLCDAANGTLLAVLDSIEITLRRTAAASALAANYLAAHDAATIAICGCGGQAEAQAQAIADVRPIRHGFAWDIDNEKAERFAENMANRLGFNFQPVTELGQATHRADIIVTCTTAQTPFLDKAHILPGAFVAAVGADNADKNEVTPALMAGAKVVVDVLEQCLNMGDLNHAVAAGAMAVGDVYCDLGSLVTGRKEGRISEADIFIFDSTGTALQDVACASTVYQKALAGGLGTSFSFA